MAISSGRRCLAAHDCMVPHVPLRHLRQCGPGGRGRYDAVSARLLPSLDARDQHRGLARRLLCRHKPVRPDGHPPRLPPSACLHQVDLCSRWIDPHPEARKLPVPEHRLPFCCGESFDRTPGDRSAVQPRRCPCPFTALLRQNVRSDALRHLGRRCPHRVPCQMSVARRGLHLPVSQQLPDHRQALPERQRPRSEAVAEVMKADAVETGPLAHAVPGAVDVVLAVALLPPRNTHGLPGTRERPASTLAAAGGGTTGAPGLLSANRISPASKSRSSHRSLRISFRRHPVSTSNRIAAAAWVDASRSAGAASNARPSL